MTEEITFERRLDARLVLSVVAAGLMSFSGVVVETAMNVTFPTLMTEFGVGTSTVQWITTGYLLVLSSMIPISSVLDRRFKLKSVFAVAVCLFLAGTLMCALAVGFPMLLVGRLIQGLGTGMALPLMFNVILGQAPKSHMGMMMGIGTLVTAIAPAIGPTVGGYLVTYVSWRAIFWVLVPLVAVAGVIGLCSLRQPTATVKARIDPLGYILLVVSFACLIFGASMASDLGWGSWQVLGLFAVCVIAMVGFFMRSSRVSDPVIHTSVFRNPVFTLSAFSMFLIQLLALGLGFLIPNFAQLTLGIDAFSAGLLLVPGCILGAVLAPLSGRVLDKVGAAKPIVFGSVCVLVSLVLFAIFGRDLGVVSTILIYLVFTLGQGFATGNSLTNGVAHLPAELSADGNAAANTLQQLSGALGTSVVSTIVASSQAVYSSDIAMGTAVGTQQAFMVLMVLAALELVFAVLIFGVFSHKTSSTMAASDRAA